MAQTDHERPLHVYFVLGVGLVSISISAILIRFAIDAPAIVVAVWRTVFASILLVPFVLRRAGSEMRMLDRREWLLILTAGVFLGLHFIVFIQSVYHTSVAHAAVLVSMSPIFIGIIGFLMLKQGLSRFEAGAIALAIGGTILMVLSTSDTVAVGVPRPFLGNSMALLASFFVAVYFLIGRHIRQDRSWLAYVGPVYATAALTTVSAALLMGVPLFGYEPKIYLLCLVMAVFPQILGHGSLNYTIKWFSAATVGIASLFEPVGASVLAFVLFAEYPTVSAVAGMACVLIAVALVLIPQGPRKRPGGRSENFLRFFTK